VCFLFWSFPPAIEGSNVSNPVQPISYWNRLSSVVPHLPLLHLLPILFPDRHIYLRSTPSSIQPATFRRTRRLFCIREFFDRPITSGFTSSPPSFRGTWKYVVTNSRARYISALAYPYGSWSAILFLAFSYMPQRCGICESFTYLAVRQEIHGIYVCAYEWVGFGVYFPGAICDRPRENYGRELRWKWEGWEKKMVRVVREIRIRLVNHNSFESLSCSSVGSLITWPRRRMKQILRFTLAKGILHSWNPVLYVHTCMRNLRRTLEISRKSRRVERLSVSFRGFP